MRGWAGLLLLPVLMLGQGCGGGQGAAAPPAASRFFALAGRDSLDGLSREEVAGRRLYFHYCAVCHGESGEGDGFNAFNLKNSFGVTPANLAAPREALSLERVQQVIAGGGPVLGKSRYMPPWGGTLDPAQIYEVASYVLALSRNTAGEESASKPPEPAPRER